MTTTTHVGAGWRFRRPSVIPGFGLTLGFTLAYFSLVILIPLVGLAVQSLSQGLDGFWRNAIDARVLGALRVSFTTALIAAGVNVVFGTLLAWVLVRYRFPGRRILDAIVDLPFALPTAVAGIALTAIYSPNGWIGKLVDETGPLNAALQWMLAVLAPLRPGLERIGLDAGWVWDLAIDWRIAYSPAGIVVALVFVGLPFVVRTVQPVLEETNREVEEASATLGATRLQTITRVLLPGLSPAILTGFALAFARAVGEYGSVIFIAGNIPYLTEIAPLLIVVRLEEFNYTGASVIAAVMLLISFALLLVINLIQAWSRKRFGYGG